MPAEAYSQGEIDALWSFLRITAPALRAQLHAGVAAERLATAAALPSRNDEFLKVKIEGLRDCAEVPLADILFENHWPEGVGGTPTAYG